MIPRPYQVDCLGKIQKAFEQHSSVLAVLATGLGKTILFSHLAKQSSSGRVLVLAHRDELIRQAADKLQAVTGEPVGIEMGAQSIDETSPARPRLVVSSVQTMSRARRQQKFDPRGFGLMVIDEAHHAVAASYQDVISHFRRNPALKLLGVTATPKRTDQLAMGQVFQSVCFDYGIEAAIADGWLVPVRQQAIVVEGLDFSKVRTLAGDFNEGELDAILREERIIHAMVAPTIEIAGSLPTLVFCASVAHAHMMADVIERYKPESAIALDGTTPKEERRAAVDAFREGKIQFLCNCLDQETEILTDQGWVGIDDMTYEHQLANWDDGKVFFDKPKFILHRERRPDERMVVLETPRRSVRVTEDHRMLYRTWHKGEFKTRHAGDLVGHVAELPVSGLADPFQIHVEQAAIRPVSAARVRANSYCLRQSGMPSAEAKDEAIRRATAREELRYANPSELSLEECEFIGFWIGDGCRGRLSGGGVEYTLAQSPTCPKIVDRIDWLVGKINIDVRKSLKKEGQYGEHWLWSFGRGTGFGPQRRRGLYRLEPYLVKTGTTLFWSLNDEQFFALIRGLWMADGNHGDNSEPPETLTACGVCRSLFDLLQSIAVCRGYRSSIRVQKRTAKPHHTPLLRIMFRKETSHRMTKYRLRFEEGWKQERVWCVTSTSGFIITRRRGTATVMGQCSLFLEGFDSPNTALVVMGRPTKSLSLYAQILGRGTRPLPGVVDGIAESSSSLSGPDGYDQVFTQALRDNQRDPAATAIYADYLQDRGDPVSLRKSAILRSAKPFMLVLDFVGNSGRHRIVRASDLLGGRFVPQVRDYAAHTAQQEGQAVPVEQSLFRAEDELALLEEIEQRKRLREEERRRRERVKARAEFAARDVSPFGYSSGSAPEAGARMTQEPATDRQVWYLVHRARWKEIDARALSKRQASAIIGKHREGTP